MRKGALSIVLLAVLGLALALALGAFAHTIARSTVALPSTTLQRADEPLAPPQARRAKRVAAPKKKPVKTTTGTREATTTSGDDDPADRDRRRRWQRQGPGPWARVRRLLGQGLGRFFGQGLGRRRRRLAAPSTTQSPNRASLHPLPPDPLPTEGPTGPGAGGSGRRNCPLPL